MLSLIVFGLVALWFVMEFKSIKQGNGSYEWVKIIYKYLKLDRINW